MKYFVLNFAISSKDGERYGLHTSHQLLEKFYFSRHILIYIYKTIIYNARSILVGRLSNSFRGVESASMKYHDAAFTSVLYRFDTMDLPN